MNTGCNTEEAIRKLKLSEIPLARQENYVYLQSASSSHNLPSFIDFLRWYSKKDVARTLEAMEKIIRFYHKKIIDLLELGCALPKTFNLCLHSSTTAKFYQLPEADKDLKEKVGKETVGGL